MVTKEIGDQDFSSTKYNTVCKILGEKGSANIILRRKRMMKMCIKSKMSLYFVKWVTIAIKLLFFRFHWIYLKD